MKCKFPELKRGGGYNRGCRCESCRSHKRERRKLSSGRPWEERTLELQRRYPIPVAPILKVLNEWMERRELEQSWGNDLVTFTTSAERPSSPGIILGQELGMTTESALKMLSRFRRGETTYTDFKTADRIVTALFGPQYWYENEELQKIYEEHA